MEGPHPRHERGDAEAGIADGPSLPLARRAGGHAAVDLIVLQPEREHPHGLAELEFDAPFTVDRPIAFALHGYPSLIHRLAYRRPDHRNLHVHGFKEEGTRTTPFDMTMRNDLDR